MRWIVLSTAVLLSLCTSATAQAGHNNFIHWQSAPQNPYRNPAIIDRTTGSWPSNVSAAASWWSGNVTNLDLSYQTGSACTSEFPTQQPGVIKVCSRDFNRACAGGGANQWLGCSEPVVHWPTNHIESYLVLFDEVVPGFTWTESARRQIACHELGHTLGLWERMDPGTCMLSEPNPSGYLTGDGHDLDVLNNELYSHVDGCCAPEGRAPGDSVRQAIPFTRHDMFMAVFGVASPRLPPPYPHHHHH